MQLRGVILIAPLLCLACGGNESGSAADAGHHRSTDAGAKPDGGSRADGGNTARDAGADGAATTSGTGAHDGSDSGAASGSGGHSGTGGVASTGSGGQGRACLSAGSYCTWSNAEDCCSGSCDGDSCCGYLGDSCENGFGCCAGDCIDGYCKCPPGTLDCGNGCVDIQWNENACGDCDTQCGVNSLCENSKCICDPNLFDAQFYEQCPDGCFNTHQDPQHCGNCTTTCTGGTECSGTTCQCPYSKMDCGNGCEDLTTKLHCGSCANVCTATQECVNQQCQCTAGQFACTPGVCVDRQTDGNNCGTCGIKCVGSKTCQAGHCAN